MHNKKGDTLLKANIGTLILGLIVIAIVFFFFREYFTQEDLDFETCRQSVLLRASAPTDHTAGVKTVSFKGDYPLKCKTQVVEIGDDLLREENGIKKAEEKIGWAIAQCWATFDSGDANLFPGETFGRTTYCVPCARIHLTDEAKQYLFEQEAVLDIAAALKRPTTGRADTYWEYLQNSGDRFSALDFGGAREFSIGTKSFSIYGDFEEGTIFNKLTQKSTTGYEIAEVNLPQYLRPTDEDFLIAFGTLVWANDDGAGDYTPYLFWFDLDKGNFENIGNEDAPFIRTKQKTILRAPSVAELSAAFCENWEGVPA